MISTELLLNSVSVLTLKTKLVIVNKSMYSFLFVLYFFKYAIIYLTNYSINYPTCLDNKKNICCYIFNYCQIIHINIYSIHFSNSYQMSCHERNHISKSSKISYFKLNIITLLIYFLYNYEISYAL